MSRWTHVAGIIRLDNFGRLVGKPMKLSDIIEMFKIDAPYGSEGALDVYGYETHPDDSFVNWATIAFEGDLRDYGDEKEDVEKILNWIKEKITILEDKYAMPTRQAIFTAEVEGKECSTCLLIDNFPKQIWKTYTEPVSE